MADNIDIKYLDRRTVERYLRSGQIDEKDYEKYLKSLEDVAEKGAPVETMMDDADFDDEDEGDDEGEE